MAGGFEKNFDDNGKNIAIQLPSTICYVAVWCR